jgi:hypothetical protein
VALGSTMNLGRRTLSVPLPAQQPELQPAYIRSEFDAA